MKDEGLPVARVNPSTDCRRIRSACPEMIRSLSSWSEDLFRGAVNLRGSATCLSPGGITQVNHGIHYTYMVCLQGVAARSSRSGWGSAPWRVLESHPVPRWSALSLQNHWYLVILLLFTFTYFNVTWHMCQNLQPQGLGLLHISKNMYKFKDLKTESKLFIR